MKDIVNVSIAGIAFRLEEEAYARLNRYLQQIRASYGRSSDGAEILGDLEARIAEIILTQQNASAVVPLALIESTLERLGAPEDISGGAADGETQKEYTAAPAEQRIANRLYRNPDGAKFGGVCNGLAAYFNADPAVVRILFAAPLILMVFFYILGWKHGGNLMTGLMTTAFILYFLLWIVIPKAKTPLQKLEMRGEKITRDRIEQTFREEFQSRSNDPANIQLRARNERNASVLSEFFSIIGKILLFFAKALAAIIGFSFILAIVGVVAALIVVMINGAGAIHGLTATSPVLLAVLICLTVLIPLSLVVYGILKMLFGFSHSRPLVSTLVVVWVLTLVFGTVIFIKDFENIELGDNISIGWPDRDRRENRELSAEERRFDRWIEEADMFGVKESTRWRQFGPYHQTAIWNVLPVTADTLFVVPMDSARMPDNFTVKIRKGHPKYPDPTLVVLKSFKGKSGQKDDRHFESLTAEHSLSGDTLRLRSAIPDIDGVSEEKVDAALFLPEHMTVVVDGRINHNEYYNQ